MQAERLVYMANQIGKFFATEDPRTAVTLTADHIKKFWDLRMRSEILAHIDAGATDLDPSVREAILTLRKPAG